MHTLAPELTYLSSNRLERLEGKKFDTAQECFETLEWMAECAKKTMPVEEEKNVLWAMAIIIRSHPQFALEIYDLYNSKRLSEGKNDLREDQTDNSFVTLIPENCIKVWIDNNKSLFTLLGLIALDFALETISSSKTKSYRPSHRYINEADDDIRSAGAEIRLEESFMGSLREATTILSEHFNCLNLHYIKTEVSHNHEIFDGHESQHNITPEKYGSSLYFMISRHPQG